jgi:hypothetical protein
MHLDPSFYVKRRIGRSLTIAVGLWICGIDWLRQKTTGYAELDKEEKEADHRAGGRRGHREGSCGWTQVGLPKADNRNKKTVTEKTEPKNRSILRLSIFKNRIFLVGS